MDSDLIQLVNKLQDTFSNLGEHAIPVSDASAVLNAIA